MPRRSVKVMQAVQERPGLEQVEEVLQSRPSRPGSRCSGAREKLRTTDQMIGTKTKITKPTTKGPDEEPEGAGDAGDPACARRRAAPCRRAGAVSVGRTCQPNSRLSSALTAFSALARLESMSPPLRTIAVAASAYALFIFGVQAGLPATASR